MKLLLIAFVAPSAVDAVVAIIQAYESWARLGDGCYLVYTHHSAECVRDSLRPHLGQGGHVYVTTTGPVAAWVGLPPNVASWIQTRQK